jgi:phosphoribosylaminoimidazolecarboxamide formyltransferase/IMP cyclohydrolase
MAPIALFSLWDTTNVDRYARALVELGWKILATRETVEILEKENIPCMDMAEYVDVHTDYGIPPTLHPKIENALTMQDAAERIELVYVISYPISVGSDIGGRTLLGLAAKGNRLPVISPGDLEEVIQALQDEGRVPDEFRRELIQKTNAEIAAHYVNLIAAEDSWNYAGAVGIRHYDLLNGENPYQQAAFYRVQSEDDLALAAFEHLGTTPPCLTNLADVDSVLNTMCLAAEAFRLRYGKQPYLAIGSKHGNPCGMAVSWDDPKDAIEKALFGNPLAVWGGELIVNFAIEEDMADIVVRHPRREEMLGSAAWMLDEVIAPDYAPKAAERLLKRISRKVYRNPALSNPHLPTDRYSYRWVRSGFIRQTPPWRVLRFEELESTGSSYSQVDVDSMIIAWATAFTSFHGGNEIALAKDGALIGAGGGPSTVQAARVAVMRAGEAQHDTERSIFCADAFFPFTDAPEVLIEAGVKLGSVPAGGKNEPLVRKLFAEKNVEMFYLPEDFRGFCRH